MTIFFYLAAFCHLQAMRVPNQKKTKTKKRELRSMRPDPMMMTTMLMKERDQIKTTQVTNMIPYLHACLLALLFASPLYLPWGLILLAFFYLLLAM
jgi:hypothetical protein